MSIEEGVDASGRSSPPASPKRPLSPLVESSNSARGGGGGGSSSDTLREASCGAMSACSVVTAECSMTALSPRDDVHPSPQPPPPPAVDAISSLSSPSGESRTTSGRCRAFSSAAAAVAAHNSSNNNSPRAEGLPPLSWAHAGADASDRRSARSQFATSLKNGLQRQDSSDSSGSPSSSPGALRRGVSKSPPGLRASPLGLRRPTLGRGTEGLAHPTGMRPPPSCCQSEWCDSFCHTLGLLPCWLRCCYPAASRGATRNKRRGGLLRRWFSYELMISAICFGLAAAEAIRLLLRVAPEDAAAGTGVLAQAWSPIVSWVQEHTTSGAEAVDEGEVQSDASNNELYKLLLDQATYYYHIIVAFVHRLMAGYENLTVLEEYQMRAALFWVRVLYGLLSLPFFVFTLPLLFEALTNSRPTGYNKHGKCVRKLTARERAAKLKEEKKREQKKMSQRLSEKYGEHSSSSRCRSPAASAASSTMSPASAREMV